MITIKIDLTIETLGVAATTIITTIIKTIIIQEKQVEDYQEEIIPTEKKVGRNEKCPCGSGKKFKHCCGNI